MTRSTRLALFLVATATLVCAVAWCASAAPAAAKVTIGLAAPASGLEPPPLVAAPKLNHRRFCSEGQKHCVAKISLAGEIEDNVADRVDFLFDVAQYEGAESILLGITSPGGDVRLGAQIFEAVATSPIPVDCVAYKMTASVAYFIYQGCRTRILVKDENPKQPTLMTHEVKVPPDAFVDEDGDPKNMSYQDLLQAGTELRSFNAMYALPIAARMEMPLDVYLTKVHPKDWFISSDDAVKLHAADIVVPTLEAAMAYVDQPKPAPAPKR